MFPWIQNVKKWSKFFFLFLAFFYVIITILSQILKKLFFFTFHLMLDAWWHSLLTQFVSATPLKLLNRISWNFVVMKDIMCWCAYPQEILIPFFSRSYGLFELRDLAKMKDTSQHSLLAQLLWNRSTEFRETL